MQNLSKILLIAGIILTLACDTVVSSEENNIRVLLLRDVKEFKLTVKGYYEIFSPETRKLIYKGKNISKAKVSCDESKIKIADLSFNSSAIEIKPRKSSYIYVNNRRYRGNLRILKTKDAKLKAINNLDLEDYLKGVLRQEVSHRWPMHTLLAQAIAARTYALYGREANKSSEFDVTAGVSSQMYGGVHSETWRTGRAVVHTTGKILIFKGKIFPTYYHATCSGHTEDASRLWNIDIMPLKGRRCDFCRESPHFSWKREMMFSDIESKLEGSKFSVKKIKNILIEDRNNSGRIMQLKIIDSDGAKSISAKDFRQLLGSDKIRSTNFSVEVKGARAHFKGFGWGHGVGMCQWGAYRMAKSGYRFDQILVFYYPESKIQKIY